MEFCLQCNNVSIKIILLLKVKVGDDMQFQKMQMVSECDGLVLSAALMLPDKSPLGIIQIVHGMSEHKERYYDFMGYLADHGYIVIIHDHRGHGDSIRDKDDFGYMYDETGNFIVEDVHLITMWVKKQFPDLPIVLFGHSMGSLVVRKYAKKYDRDLDGLIVCGSPSKSRNINLGLWLIRQGMKKYGDHYRSNFVNNLATGKSNKKFDDGTSKKLWLSSNRDSVQLYDDDPKCGFVFTLNGFLNLLLLLKSVYDKSGWRLASPNLPIFFIAGADDPVIINERAWKKSIKFMKKLGYANVSCKLYPGMRHEILNETDNRQVYSDILNWIENK
jgi:alpha-beta hydrolase superfamily lysophospholipase